MSFKKLRELLGENSEALKMIDTLEGNSSTNVETISRLERSITDITETRDKFKSGNSLVKKVLGLDQLNETTLEDALALLKGNKGDDASKAEIENLKGLIEKANSDASDSKNGYESQIQTMALENAIANSGIGADVANKEMLTIVMGLVKQNATYEDGKIVYKNNGTTVFDADNKPVTIESRVNALKSDVNYAGLFKADSNGGSGTRPNGQSGSGTNNLEGMNPTEMMKAGRQ